VTLAPFDPRPALVTLCAHDVGFVMIGGLAASLHGSPSITGDLDICPARDDANLGRLADALRELRAVLRGAPPDVPFLLDAKTLAAGDHFTFTTTAGAIDCLGTPAGTSGFDELKRNAVEMDLGSDLSIRVASIDDLIRMKLAAGRPKDLIEVEVLGALRDELEGR